MIQPGAFVSSDSSPEIIVADNGTAPKLFVGKDALKTYWDDKAWRIFLILPIEESKVENISADESGTAIYYNLNGVEIKNPEKGQIVIEVKNGNTQKRLIYF